jgi:exonuclease SbcD
MRILHTADLHLQTDDERTIAALEDVLTKAAQYDVDALTIAGDIFDSPQDANELRPRLRTLFSDNPFDIIAIPGNHDESVYESNLDFGRDIDILVNSPVEKWLYQDVTVAGVPYTDTLSEELFSALSRPEDEETTSILLLHCTLDIGFGSDEVGDESETAYFPVTKSTLAKLGYDFVLAGHIHSSVRTVPLSNDGTFVYPGSPVSHSTKETGRRHAVLIDTEEQQARSIPLETYYFDRYAATVSPGNEDELVDDIQQWAAERTDAHSDLEIVVDGFITREEDAFRDSLAALEGNAEIVNETRDVSAVLDHPLYQQFEAELDAEDIGAVPEAKVETRVIQVLSRLLAGREIRP